MGGYYSKQNWYVYSRDLETDSWNPTPVYENTESKNGIFKHLIYKFALQTTIEDTKMKALYIYHGSDRLCKAYLLRPVHDDFYKLELEFKNEKLANEWDLCDEEILDGTVLLWREIDFNKHYVSLPEACKYKRRWQLVKPLNNKNPKKLSIGEYLHYSNSINEQV